ncbi:DNA repair exonuclease rad1 [Tricharina praecox]|uniref:DNA repair exonuclease rad1 n=1 Tax=Tricharina praecox TaxID=43433 RepID=UPI00221EC095|nr:DNA repair exonuclease rad1 [Tricharina praecox]KAI5850626.1 DNA repair exonuclease rad1 [Tricharina praecox]
MSTQPTQRTQRTQRTQPTQAIPTQATPATPSISPIFSATTTSARQLFNLLKCCGFQPRAQMELLAEGIKVTVEDSRVMQGHILVDRHLFSSYTFTPPPSETTTSTTSSSTSTVSFGISFASLLECLQIFGAEREREKWHSAGAAAPHSSAFDQQVLRISGTCRISYRGVGFPLALMLEENGTITTCTLSTYPAEEIADIPLSLSSLALKVIMKASWLQDAIQELEGSMPERLTLAASPQRSGLSLSAAGAMGSTEVEFLNDKALLQSYRCDKEVLNTYKFALIKNAARAMAIASKVSIRGDGHGVLSMQFMIEQEGGVASFVDFRFLPYVGDDEAYEED